MSTASIVSKAWRLLIAVGWLVAILVTQAWPAWSKGIVEQFAHDIQSYEQIARAAPGLPSATLPEQHAERFPVHWLIGVVDAEVGIGLHAVYRIVSLAVLGALVAIVALTLRRLQLRPAAYSIALGTLVASAYPFRYLLAAPGMVADGVFLLGFGIALFGLVAEAEVAIVLGLVLATAGRQTAVPVAVVFAALLARLGRRGAAVAAVVLPIGLYVAMRVVASPFGSGGVGGAHSVVAAVGRPRELADHLGRLALPLLVPAAVIAGACLRTRLRPPLAPLALAAAVALQPLVLDPAWVIENEPRLAGLAAPATTLAAAYALSTVRLRLFETGVVATATLLAGLHARYSDVGVGRASVWVGLDAAAALVILATLARPRARGSTLAER